MKKLVALSCAFALLSSQTFAAYGGTVNQGAAAVSGPWIATPWIAGGVNSATNGLYFNLLQGNSVISSSNPVPITGSISGYDSGPVSATATPANSSHAAGVSVGGLFAVALARTSGGSGIMTSALVISTGGFTGGYTMRIWSRNPTNSTCTDNTNFAGSILDDIYLMGFGPVTMVPAAPTNTTGDAKTYAALSGVTWDYATNGNQNVYVCLVANATDTADQNNAVKIILSGPQN
jgi:hypothetical protein